MSETISATAPTGSRVHFDWTIRLDTVVACAVALVSVAGVFFTLKGEVSTNTRDIEKLTKLVEEVNKAKVDKEVAGKAELELSRRIVETQQKLTDTAGAIASGFSEVKGLIRDLDQKLDRKADKPGR